MKKLILMAVLTLLHLQTTSNTSLSKPSANEVISIETVVLTKKTLIEFINMLPIQHKKILYQKIMLETGHLKSVRCLRDNNLIGMKCVKVRNTTQTGSHTSYGVYDDWRDSIIDYLLWQQHCIKKRLTEKEYYDYTCKVYSINKDKYINVLKQIKVPNELAQ